MDDEVRMQVSAVMASATRWRRSGDALGDARDRHADAAAVPTAVAAAHTACVARWTEGLRVAAVGLVEVGNALDACARAAADQDEATAVEFRGVRG